MKMMATRRQMMMGALAAGAGLALARTGAFAQDTAAPATAVTLGEGEAVWPMYNLNLATEEQLLAVPGVDEKMLDEFMEYRPYTTVGQFIEEIGFGVSAMRHLSRPGPVAIAHTTQAALRQAVEELAESGCDAIIQFGANLPMGQLAATEELRLGMPVIAVNTATYWHALRSRGILDRKPGFGRLMAEF